MPASASATHCGAVPVARAAARIAAAVRGPDCTGAGLVTGSGAGARDAAACAAAAAPCGAALVHGKEDNEAATEESGTAPWALARALHANRPASRTPEMYAPATVAGW